jgi:hypothetical protein
MDTNNKNLTPLVNDDSLNLDLFINTTNNCNLSNVKSIASINNNSSVSVEEVQQLLKRGRGRPKGTTKEHIKQKIKEASNDWKIEQLIKEKYGFREFKDTDGTITEDETKNMGFDPRLNYNDNEDKNFYNVCLTIFNYDKKDIVRMDDYFKNNQKKIPFVIMCEEVCPTTGKKHLQGYMEINSSYNMSLKSIRKNIHKDIYVSPRYLKSTWEDCCAYVTKGEQSKEEYQQMKHLGPNFGRNEKRIIHYGEPKKKKRNDDMPMKDKVKITCSMIMKGETTPDEVMNKDPVQYQRFYKTLNDVYDEYKKLKSRQVTKNMRICLWLWGKTGTGKSKFIRDYIDSLNKVTGNEYTYYNIYKHKGWWDTYEGQNIAIFDDFRESADFKFNDVLNLCDKFDYKVPRRNKKPICFNSEFIFFTSPLPPWKAFTLKSESDDINQLFRRMDVIEFHKGKFNRCLYEGYDDESTKVKTHFNDILSIIEGNEDIDDERYTEDNICYCFHRENEVNKEVINYNQSRFKGFKLKMKKVDDIDEYERLYIDINTNKVKHNPHLKYEIGKGPEAYIKYLMDLPHNYILEGKEYEDVKNMLLWKGSDNNKFYVKNALRDIAYDENKDPKRLYVNDNPMLLFELIGDKQWLKVETNIKPMH